jgi:hypothetical protein
MTGNCAKPQKTRERIENELLEDLRQKRAEWIKASEDNRDLARQRFINALLIFDIVVIHKTPLEDLSIGRREFGPG